MKKITMKDIAIKAGVSKATVSMVLNKKDSKISKETKEKITKLAEDLNYIPNGIARSLTTKKSQTIGIILPDIINPFFSEMARAIEDTANKLDYNVIFCNTDSNFEKEESYIKLLISKLVDGVIFITGRGNKESLDILKQNNVSFVLVDRYIENNENYPGVYCLNKEGIVRGVEYLIKKGRQRIAFVTGNKDLSVSKQRIEGYIETMNKHDRNFEGLIFESDFTLDGGIQITEEILQCNKNIDAIFYSNDVMALGGLKVLKRRQFIVPEDINVIGFDNIKISNFIEPELTTIAQPIYDMGKKACELLIDVINNKDITKQVFFKTNLVKGGTA
ncbi:LacI family DNA-binding transcriptional regulator [Clostridium botulinum]|uniref:LacI family DNA-binding transcriptional regulator n=1 Tax=Clostridium botulinum TaxID=1491 RepID=UPI0004D960C2|nr:LacI family DNA-binding transcriptional regulator [Clostridium botulinum]KEI01074.1 LacI family transcriptional regulator [Clostridium botulinum C/D str. BKT75002]KEI13447.1 LacI family transcriptional regulator [Clostridium botulinum C/D str. BKT2873]QPW61248.1 LacI family DNA-binding transcriptional regulator [Clostridium botulinum]